MSHHPPSTFKAILYGEAQRILIASSTAAAWLTSLNEFRDELELAARGYSQDELMRDFMGALEYKDRQRLLQPKEAKGGSAVLALKLPFTPRTDHIAAPTFLRSLHAKAESNPAVRALLTGARWLTAHKSTSNLRAKLQAR